MFDKKLFIQHNTNTTGHSKMTQAGVKAPFSQQNTYNSEVKKIQEQKKLLNEIAEGGDMPPIDPKLLNSHAKLAAQSIDSSDHPAHKLMAIHFSKYLEAGGHPSHMDEFGKAVEKHSDILNDEDRD